MRTTPDQISQIPLPDGTVAVDEAGYLTDPETWTKAFAAYAAAQEGITLTDRHWQVIAFMRDYQAEHGIAADARFVLKYLAEQGDKDKSGARKELYDLFPYGYVRQACKMAGMKQPRAWSTG